MDHPTPYRAKKLKVETRRLLCTIAGALIIMGLIIAAFYYL